MLFSNRLASISYLLSKRLFFDEAGKPVSLLNHCERQLLAHLAQSIFRGREFKIVQMNGSLLCKGR